MGCPDWPKCFGAWIPPTAQDQLPLNYKEQYVKYRQEKNIRLAGYMESIGFKNKAELVRNDPSILEESEFNIFKTWTEYVNRLIGALIGILVIMNLIFSIRIIKQDSALFFWSLVLLVTVIFQGWIGSLVVSTNLLPWMVTVHMLLAMVIIAMLTFLVFKSRKEYFKKYSLPSDLTFRFLLVFSLIVLILQVVFGTQVRETIDTISATLNQQNRDTWISRAGISFLVHRSFSLLVLALQLWVAYYMHKHSEKNRLAMGLFRLLLLVTGLEIGLGAGMAYFSIPAVLQPFHLLFAMVMFGILMLVVLLILNRKNNSQPILT
jgi:cytochrome c oxidase assembly protein subunit 15